MKQYKSKYYFLIFCFLFVLLLFVTNCTRNGRRNGEDACRFIFPQHDTVFWANQIFNGPRHDLTEDKAKKVKCVVAYPIHKISMHGGPDRFMSVIIDERLNISMDSINIFLHPEEYMKKAPINKIKSSEMIQYLCRNHETIVYNSNKLPNSEIVVGLVFISINGKCLGKGIIDYNSFYGKLKELTKNDDKVSILPKD